MAEHSSELSRGEQTDPTKIVAALCALPWQLFMPFILSDKSNIADLLYKLEHVSDIKSRLSKHDLPELSHFHLFGTFKDRLDDVISSYRNQQDSSKKRPPSYGAMKVYMQEVGWTAEGAAQTEEERIFRQFWKLLADADEINFLAETVDMRASVFSWIAPLSRWRSEVRSFKQKWIERVERLFAAGGSLSARSKMRSINRDEDYKTARSETIEIGRELATRLRCVAKLPPNTLSGLYSKISNKSAELKRPPTVSVRKEEGDIVVDVTEAADGEVERRQLFLPSLTITCDEYINAPVCLVNRFEPDAARVNNRMSQIPCVRVASDGSAFFTAQGLEVLDFLLLWNADTVRLVSMDVKMKEKLLWSCINEKLLGSADSTSFSTTADAQADDSEVSSDMDKRLQVTLMSTGEVVTLQKALTAKLVFLKKDPVLPMPGATRELLEQMEILASCDFRYKASGNLPIHQHLLVQMLELADQLGLTDETKWLQNELTTLLRMMNKEDLEKCFLG